MQLQGSRPARQLLLWLQMGVRQGSRSCLLKSTRLQMQVGLGLASAKYKPEHASGDRSYAAAQPPLVLTDH